MAVSVDAGNSASTCPSRAPSRAPYTAVLFIPAILERVGMAVSCRNATRLNTEDSRLVKCEYRHVVSGNAVQSSCG